MNILQEIYRRKSLLWSLLAVVSMVSCASPRQMNYLQDMNQTTQIELENKFQAVIAPYDELVIRVSCYDQELAKPFNWMGEERLNTEGGARTTYLVDVNGNIQFPILGDIHVKGMTRLDLQSHIDSLLRSGHYIEDPFTTVRFYNFKVFFLGSDGGKAITIPNERCTFLEALAMSGDLDALTRRDKIAVLREVDGKMTMRYLDPRSSEVFNDPYFLLKQNDMIITESRGVKYVLRDFTYWGSFFGIISAAVSLGALVYTIVVNSSK